MKANKTSPLTIERKARFAAEEPNLAPLLTMTPENAFAGELNALADLSRELVGIDTPEMIQARIASEGTVQGYRENCPELYGRATQAPFAMFANGLPTFHKPGATADCELSEVESALVQTAGHTYGGQGETEPEAIAEI